MFVFLHNSLWMSLALADTWSHDPLLQNPNKKLQHSSTTEAPCLRPLQIIPIPLCSLTFMSGKLHSGTSIQLLIKAAAVVSLWRREGRSGLPLGNQFAKADAQRGTNFCGLQQLFKEILITKQSFFFGIIYHLFTVKVTNTSKGQDGILMTD